MNLEMNLQVGQLLLLITILAAIAYFGKKWLDRF